MSWQEASVIMTAIVTIVGALLTIRKSKNKDHSDSTLDIKSTTKMFVEMQKLESNQENLKENMNRFKDDVQHDIETITKKIDNLTEKLIK